ncbi:LysE family translocator [Ramlibacter solisilvae]|uniref:Lysine transporter LysE n=1 Tax=Ramlibacter tataouinensis TaxID=94132 RepID=A0A127JUT4_9BURK|nr:LysE family translocator [Ramlibacter tataouinensis]AMO23654.1 lysine transporter LysE [Ramlibacter tataouinensis]
MDPVLFFPIAVLIALTPGPNNFCALNNGIRQGVIAALVGTVGRVIAFAILLTISAIGLATTLLASESAFNVLKWVGAGYLVWLGVRCLRSKERIGFVDRQGTGTCDDRSMQKLMLQEFLLGISNPKAILLFASLFPQFINPSMPGASQFLALGATYLLAEFVSSLTYALGGRQLRRFIASRRGGARLNMVTAGVFIGAGVLLLASRR